MGLAYIHFQSFIIALSMRHLAPYGHDASFFAHILHNDAHPTCIYQNPTHTLRKFFPVIDTCLRLFLIFFLCYATTSSAYAANALATPAISPSTSPETSIRAEKSSATHNDTRWEPLQGTLKNADIVLRYRPNSWGKLLQRFGEQYSHIGILYFPKTTPYVIHMDVDNNGKGSIITEPLSLFLNNAERIRILRMPLPETLRASIITQAFVYKAQKIPFDLQMDLSKNSAMYCTEYVWRTFYAALSRDILQQRRHRKYILCSDFAQAASKILFSGTTHTTYAKNP